MIKINENYLKLEADYLFASVASRVREFEQKNPGRELVWMGIGDVTQPLPPACIVAFHRAVAELAQRQSFRGYGPSAGYGFLREAIARHDFQARGADISADEVFVSDGAKCDSANVQELFARELRLAIPDPVYPVYLESNVMAGRTGVARDGRYEGVTYLEATPANGYVPDLPAAPVDLIYLCFPNNPTGATATREQLGNWVDWARANRALILFDAAYESYIRDPDLPHSIYEIPGAQQVAIEFRSYSKSAGFTGVRCAYTVVPAACTAYTADGAPVALRELWRRRQDTKSNGVSYPVQRAAEALYGAEGQRQVRALTDGYLANAACALDALGRLGYRCSGGSNSPYIWLQVEGDSWTFFDRLLQRHGVVCTPGAGFGRCGEHHVRLSAFSSLAHTREAMRRMAGMH
ncbi:MAG: LL-diaminopimelate aminotransferase [Ottowia sp.]|nr:LL-diaminopimelate aminotransferase [Ottowia sp.]